VNDKPLSPLTGTHNVSQIGSVPTAELIAFYRRSGLDVASEFPAIDAIAVWQCMESGLKFTVPCVSGSEKFYSELEKSGTAYPKEKFEFGLAAKLIRPEMQLLDIGCGFGHFSDFAEQASYTGLEYSSHAVQHGKARGRNILLESAQEHAQRLGPVYDMVVSFQVLEHVCDPLSFLKAAAACLKPGGRLVVGVPADDSFLGMAANNLLNLPPHHVTFWPARALKYALETIGLSDIASEHESLHSDHSFFCAEQMVLSFLRGGGAPRQYVCHNARFRVLNKFSYWAAGPLSRFLNRHPDLIRGHTLVASGIKKV
jgi:SAM-dependent methyltransferase